MNEGGEKKLDILIEAVGALTETVEFIKDNAAMQASVDTLQNDVSGLRNDVSGLRTEMHAGFANVDIEFRSVRGEIREVKDKVDRIDKRTEEDVNALVDDQLKLKRTVLKMQKGIA